MIAGQLGKLFGISIQSEQFYKQIGELLAHLSQTRTLTLLIGLAQLVFLLLLNTSRR